MKKRTVAMVLLLALVTALLAGLSAGCATGGAAGRSEQAEDTDRALPKRGENYYDVENVALYLKLYGALPPNYITKNEARDLGWAGGTVEKYNAGAAIGGDRFSNREGLLPEAAGRVYTECDIATNGTQSRGAQRLVFSNDGLYFFSDDHYESFRELTITENNEVIWK